MMPSGVCLNRRTRSERDEPASTLMYLPSWKVLLDATGQFEFLGATTMMMLGGVPSGRELVSARFCAGFRPPERQSLRALWWPAAEKRQGTKSWVGNGGRAAAST
jgi:hypothetical protein